MDFQGLIKRYLDALQSGNVAHILSVFEEDGVVLSPLYGKMTAKQFYSDLSEDTNESKITLLNTLQSYENEDTCAGHFKYDWTMKDGSIVTFECVDVFKVSPNNKFKQLTIIYDTYGTVRDNFNKLKRN
ncbi:MAG: nuclear transport factor 2 family protein [Solirubrobacterales bacterium]